MSVVTLLELLTLEDFQGCLKLVEQLLKDDPQNTEFRSIQNLALKKIEESKLPEISTQTHSPLDKLLKDLKSNDICIHRDLALKLQSSPSLLKSFLNHPELKSHWRQVFFVAKEAAKINCFMVSRLMCEQVLIWEPEYWFARELPRQFEGYYSQLNQDRIIEQFFQKRGSRTRRFIEVGAFDGIHYSNVRRLHKTYGWSGICIEPVRKNFQKLLDSYAGTSVKCIRAAVSDKESKLNMHVSTYPHLPEWGSDVASLDKKETKRWEKYQAVWEEESVQVLTLNSILDQHHICGFDFISIDAEGHDLAVLKGIHFKKHTPLLVCVEYGENRQSILEYMQSQGYQLYMDNRQDLFFEWPISNETTSIEQVEGKLHPHLKTLQYFHGSTLTLSKTSPSELIQAQRFDLGAKLLYGRYLLQGIYSDFGEDVYREHLQVFNGMSEEEKKGFPDFKNSFQTLLQNLKERGFDSNTSLLPIDAQGVIVDGAHRVAACALLNQSICTLVTSRPSNRYDSAWFLSRGLSRDTADAMACEYIRWKPHSILITLFPAAVGKEGEVISLLNSTGNIVYQKDFELQGDAPTLLIWQMYRHETWVGDAEVKWAGATHKAKGCFPLGKGTVRTYLFEPHQQADLKKLKATIRDLYGVGNHSVHINDTHRETKLLGSIYFNANSLHFLNNAKLNAFPNFLKLFSQFQAGLVAQKKNEDEVCIDGSAVMSAYGIRDCRDIDFIHHGVDDLNFGNPALIGSHNKCSSYHATDYEDILNHPKNHFYFHGIKFTSLALVMAMKQNRGEGKDSVDIQLIRPFLANPSFPCSVPHIQKNRIQKPFTLKGRPLKIIGLVTMRNESSIVKQCLKSLAKVTDSIIVLDDASTDNSIEICQQLKKECCIEHIIRKQEWFRDEPGDRNRLLNAGRFLGGTHFIMMDADECFTANLLEGDVLKQQILALQEGDYLELQWLQLWRSTSSYRTDPGIWNPNYKPFVFRDNWSSFYTSDFIHTPRIPFGLKGRALRIPGPQVGVMHFQFVEWENLLIKQAWYRCLELIRNPAKNPEEINKKYAPSKNEEGLQTEKVPASWFTLYESFDYSGYISPDNWRKDQVLAWFSQYGKNFFAKLDIWDITWSEKINRVLPSPEVILQTYPLQSVPGKPGYVSWKGIHGFLTAMDIVKLYQTAFELPKGAKILEIGSFFGLSSCIMANALRDAGNETARIYCIDLWENYHGSSLEAFKANCEKSGALPYIIPIQENSSIAVQKFKKASLDLIFIDGNHTYEGVSADLSLYWDKIAEGRVILGHDYAPGSKGVLQAVAEFKEKFPSWKFIEPLKGSSVFSLIPPPQYSLEVSPTSSKVNPESHLNLAQKNILVYVGMHKGTSFDKIFKNYRICICFEANPELYQELKIKYQNYSHVHLFHAAVGTKNGSIPFHISSNNGASSSIGKFNTQWEQAHSGKIQMQQSITVPSVNLYDFLRSHEIDEIDDYISDIQGMDLEVIKTLWPLIKGKKIGSIQCEVQKNGKPQIYGDLPSNQFSEFENLFLNRYQLVSKGWGDLVEGCFSEVPEDWWEFDAKWRKVSVTEKIHQTILE